MEEAFARLYREMMRLSARLRRIEEALGVRPEAPGRRPSASHRTPGPTLRAPSPIVSVWSAAPLGLRLRFARDLLQADHPLQSALKEAAALEDLRGRGSDLEAWLTNYPSLFVDAISRVGGGEEGRGVSDLPSSDAAEALATETLAEARRALDACLAALGVEWIAPRPGARITDEQEVVGEEEATSAPGTVARLHRLGFRWQGRLYQPAQVWRTAAKRPSPPPALPDGTPEVAAAESSVAEEATASRPAVVGADRWPDWLRTLHLHGFGQDSLSARAILDVLSRLVEGTAHGLSESFSEGEMRDLLEPLLPLLGPRYAAALSDLPPLWSRAFEEAREPLQTWLRDVLGITILSPANGEPFRREIMETVGTRRTAHPREAGTVARVERVGLQWQGRLLFPAQVVRYAME